MKDVKEAGLAALIAGVSLAAVYIAYLWASQTALTDNSKGP